MWDKTKEIYLFLYVNIPHKWSWALDSEMYVGTSHFKKDICNVIEVKFPVPYKTTQSHRKESSKRREEKSKTFLVCVERK